ncbi:hypothetical protein [Legionella sp. km772]|uniref:hypothetical protein n=1 Tax=Legionella sp. km772 TaxID=2498111 RepID=UPI000F8C30E9|nr:hypothetical protein [Legionella sp. km772]RUR07224.1 hypothetical protein ELY15_12360 [Legionella sp. km772]
MIKSNQEIAALLLQFADLLEVNGENPYKVRAYRRAAQSISALHEQISDLLAKNKDLTEINWVGKGIATSINHLLNNDELIIHEKSSSSEEALELLPGLGKKRVGILKKHQIHNKEELMQAAESGQLAHLKWLNQKLLEKIKDNKLKYKRNSFIRLYHAFPMNKLLTHVTHGQF